MKKSILIIAILSISITSCQKEKVQEIQKPKAVEKTYLQVQAIDYYGNVSASTNIITVK